MAPPRRATLPIFPLNTVLFPGGVLPLRIFEQRYMAMAKTCLKDGSAFGVCLIREGAEVGKPAIPEAVGCTARIIDWDMQQLGLLLVRTLGEQRFTILDNADNGTGLRIAQVEFIAADSETPLPDELADSETPLPDELADCARVLEKIIAGVGEEPFQKPFLIEDTAWVGNRLCEILPIRLGIKQKLMELTDPVARLQLVARFMQRQGLLG